MTEALSPHELAEEGKRLFAAGTYVEADRLFQAAALGYSQTGDALSVAEMGNNRCVTLLKAGQPAAALQAVEGSDAVFAANHDVRRQGMALGNLGAAYEALERYEEAMSAYERAAELFKQIGEADLRSPVLKSLSALQLRSGRSLEAVATMNAGLQEGSRSNRFEGFLKKLLEIPLKWIFRS